MSPKKVWLPKINSYASFGMADARQSITSMIICGLSKPQHGRVPSICTEYAMVSMFSPRFFPNRLYRRRRNKKTFLESDMYARASSVRKRNASPFMDMVGDERDFLSFFRFYIPLRCIPPPRSDVINPSIFGYQVFKLCFLIHETRWFNQKMLKQISNLWRIKGNSPGTV